MGTSQQIAFDFKPPPVVGAQHVGPGFEDDGTGCDCCAERLLCGVCGARYLGRGYAYYYRWDTKDADGYRVGMNGSYGNLPGPCCLPEDVETFDLITTDDDSVPELPERLVRKGQVVFGACGVLRARIWIPTSWPTGESPWERDYREAQASHRRRRA